MIVYVTKPDNHEMVMGGWRQAKLWTEEPHFYHCPESGYRPLSGDPNATFLDRGWAVNGSKSQTPFKPLVRQNAELESKCWELMCWSCIPRSANVDQQFASMWAGTILEGEDPTFEFYKNNWHTLLWHVGGNTDIYANVHWKRFLMKVNLVTHNIELVTPMVHIYKGISERTSNISEELANRYNYAVPELQEGGDDYVPF